MQSSFAGKRKDAPSSMLNEMERIASRMRTIIVSMPPEDLLGYIYYQSVRLAGVKNEGSAEDEDSDGSIGEIDDFQFLLEYVHAVLASDDAPDAVNFDEEKVSELFELSRKLRQEAMFYAMASSANTTHHEFGPDTADLEFHAKSSWVVLRGNRYQVLESEFYRFVLAPHDDILREVYGVGAAEIAAGIQDITNANRTGQADAVAKIGEQFEAAKKYALEKGKALEEVMGDWAAENSDEIEAARSAVEDLLHGGIANVSRHTDLPNKLLEDLAYERGEDKEFFADGEFSGTPYRTLPARKKPLVKLGTDYFAVDLCLFRDAGYRALLFNMLERRPDYKEPFKERQKIMSEGAFPEILSSQLPGATVFREVYYKDPVTRQWVENDTLILLDDVLYLVEAKAGAAATIASPALDFKRHAQSIKDLVLKAYKQCERFFNYLNSADQVPLYNRVNDDYQEIGRIRRSDYRVMIPIGLTVESFCPFSTYCKDLPAINPLLQKHGFISMSIDDLFVIKRILPTAGAFAHYMEVRQAVAAMKHAHLFDELDHLGAYISRNRFDMDIAQQLAESSNAKLVIWDRMGDVIDRYFEGENWEANPIPKQEFPEELLKLLKALDETRSPGWLFVDSLVRNYGEHGRRDIAKWLSEAGKTLDEKTERYFALDNDGELLFIWMQSSKIATNWQKINDQATASALYAKLPAAGLFIEVGNRGSYVKAEYFGINPPDKKTADNEHIYAEAERIAQRMKEANAPHSPDKPNLPAGRKIGRNDPCPCGSGNKYKKCHGR